MITRIKTPPPSLLSSTFSAETLAFSGAGFYLRASHRHHHHQEANNTPTTRVKGSLIEDASWGGDPVTSRGQFSS